MGEMIKVDTLSGDDRFVAYLATPTGQDAKSAPAIVVIQEIFGVNAGIRAMCDDWAAAGYVALAPDLFWRLEPGVELSDKTDAEWQRALALMNKFDVDAGVRDIEASLRALRGRADVNGKVGTVGFCLGGKLAYLAATRTDTDASTAYYGVGIEALLGESHAIAQPLMMHIAAEDQFVDAAAQAAIHGELDAHPKVTLHDYEGADHAFARVDGSHRKDDAAQLANARTLEFFRAHLG